MAAKLPNYLRTFRKRAYLTQDELAFLLGGESGARVSRFEHFTREPDFSTALACLVVFREGPQALFAGDYERTVSAVHRRAATLLGRVQGKTPTAVLRRKLESLRAIASLTATS